jgi:uncharacterized protein
MSGLSHTVDFGTAERIVARTSDFVRARLGGEPTGHDWWHAQRVRGLAREIAEREGADLLVVELAALVHDVADRKVGGDIGLVRSWLDELPINDETRDEVLHIVGGVSYHGAGVPDEELSLAGRCVRDADRLDAMGAIGVARAFAYGGRMQRQIHDPGVQAVMHTSTAAYHAATGPTINHFYEKLLLLRDRLTTEAGRELGRRRHDFLLAFLTEFHAEWDEAVAPLG